MAGVALVVGTDQAPLASVSRAAAGRFAGAGSSTLQLTAHAHAVPALDAARKRSRQRRAN